MRDKNTPNSQINVSQTYSKIDLLKLEICAK